MDYAKLLERCRDIDESKVGSAKKFVVNAEQIIENNFINYLLVEDAKRFLHINGAYGRTEFYLRKKYLSVLYDILVEDGVVSREHAQKVLSGITNGDIISREYIAQFMFKDLDDVLDMISSLGKAAIQEGDMLYEKSLTVLLWHGVEVDEIIQIHKSDLCENPYGVRVGDKLVRLHKYYFDILDKYASIATYRAYPSGKCYELTESPWLFRSWKKQQLDTNNIRTRLKQFNQSEYVIASGKTFGVDELKKNGRFYSIFMKQAVFNDKFEKNNKKSLYDKWVDYYWSEK